MIDIPGYRILRALGRGGMATVYLALQESVQRQIALKVMSPTLIGDSEFGERFLREARIAANLHHPHIVQVHDVGRAGDLHYIAMEFLSGGPVLHRDEAPRGLAFALRVVREIASALDFAHRRGVIHRDIKPDNIMLREDGAAVLSDFGIARASDSKRMTLTGTILGTPHYMAPEQASGAPVDGRADLYALGIVFHELLIGRVPFDADDWVSVGLMHLQAPVPRLPAAHAALQPLLDRLLAKSPDDRFATGGELARAIEAIEDSLDPSKRSAVPGDRAQHREPTLDADAEPVLGDLERVNARASPRRRRRTDESRAAARRSPWLVVAGGVLVLAGGLYVGRDVLRDWLPSTRHEALLAEADAALRGGRLGGARELYQAVLALDPDHGEARAGLARVAEGLLGEARKAIEDDRIEDARKALQGARDAGAPATEADAIEAAVRERSRIDGELATLINAAQAAFAEGRLDAEGGALALYRRALAIDPANAIALAGQREVLAGLLQLAVALAAAGNLDAALAQVDAVEAVDAGHLGLPEARARLAEARQATSGAIERTLREASALQQQGRLVRPAGGSARDRYRDVLALQPAHPAALAGLRDVGQALLRQAERRMADYEFDAAAALLADARSTVPDLAGLKAAESRLAEMRQRRGQVASGQLDEAQRGQLAQILDAADAAVAAGQLVYPPGESGYDLYRRALAIERGNARATQGLAALPGQARTRFEQALGANRLAAARGYLEGLETLAPADGALTEMRRRLAGSLLGFAAERLGAGEIARASGAIDQAAEVDPSHPDLVAMRARLEQAQRR